MKIERASLFVWWTSIVLCVGVAFGIFIGAIAEAHGVADMRQRDESSTEIAWKAVDGWEVCVAEQRLNRMLLRGCYGTDFDGRGLDSDVATESTGATLPP